MTNFALTLHARQRAMERFPFLDLEASVKRSVRNSSLNGDEEWVDWRENVVFVVSLDNDGWTRVVLTVMKADHQWKTLMELRVGNEAKKRSRGRKRKR